MKIGEASILRRTLVCHLAALPQLFTSCPSIAAPTYNPGETPEDLSSALGGLKPGTGRPLNALIKFRAETGVQRLSSELNPLFKPGQILDELLTAEGTAQIAFAFPADWTLAGGPNLDVRNVREADSAFVLAAPLPKGVREFDKLPNSFLLDVIFDPAGKYGQYGKCDDRKVVSSTLESFKLPSGGMQSYRHVNLKFAPLSYNGNTVERRALVSATATGGTVFILVAGSLANRFKKLQPELADVQQSFRAIASTARRAAPAVP